MADHVIPCMPHQVLIAPRNLTLFTVLPDPVRACLTPTLPNGRRPPPPPITTVLPAVDRPTDSAMRQVARSLAWFDRVNATTTSSGKTLPLPCLSAVFVAKTVPFLAVLSHRQRVPHVGQQQLRGGGL